jgi:hypothetical protein
MGTRWTRVGADLLNRSAAFYILATMIRGRIAIPDVDPKTWRSRGRKKRKQPALASTIVTPPPMKKRRQMTDDEEQPQRSAIVEPKKPRNTMLAHLLDDITPEEHRRAGEKANELFREIVRRAAKRD